MTRLLIAVVGGVIAFVTMWVRRTLRGLDQEIAQALRDLGGDVSTETGPDRGGDVFTAPLTQSGNGPSRANAER